MRLNMMVSVGLGENCPKFCQVKEKETNNKKKIPNSIILTIYFQPLSEKKVLLHLIYGDFQIILLMALGL